MLPKNHRPPRPKDVKGGCSPQNNNIFGFFGVKFRKKVENLYVPFMRIVCAS